MISGGDVMADCYISRRAGKSETNNSGMLCSTEVYTGTEYNGIVKSINELKQELVDYFGFGNDGDFIPCNADGTLGYKVTSSSISIHYGADKTEADLSTLGTSYTVIVKNDDLLVFNHKGTETQIAARNTSGDYVLITTYKDTYNIVNPTAEIDWSDYKPAINSISQYSIVPFSDLISGEKFNALYCVLSSRSTAKLNNFVDFGGDIYSLFGNEVPQFAAKVN